MLVYDSKVITYSWVTIGCWKIRKISNYYIRIRCDVGVRNVDDLKEIEEFGLRSSIVDVVGVWIDVGFRVAEDLKVNDNCGSWSSIVDGLNVSRNNYVRWLWCWCPGLLRRVRHSWYNRSGIAVYCMHTRERICRSSKFFRLGSSRKLCMRAAIQAFWDGSRLVRV